VSIAAWLSWGIEPTRAHVRQVGGTPRPRRFKRSAVMLLYMGTAGSNVRPPTLFNQAASNQVTLGRGELPTMRIILPIN
jgi:hypothetical protein